MAERLYGVTCDHKKINITFRKVNIGDVIWVDKKTDEFFKVVEVFTINLVFFKINFMKCDFYWNCL